MKYRDISSQGRHFVGILALQPSPRVEPTQAAEEDDVVLDLPSCAFESKHSAINFRWIAVSCFHRLSKDSQVVQTAAKSLVGGNIHWLQERAGHQAHWTIQRLCQGKRTSMKRPAHRTVPSRFWPISSRSSVDGAYPQGSAAADCRVTAKAFRYSTPQR